MPAGKYLAVTIGLWLPKLETSRNSMRSGSPGGQVAAAGILVRLPFPVVGLDTGHGGESINHALFRWAGEKDNFFARAPGL
jgi:hypothetical protein